MRITAREKEIADLIRKEPMITQEELAARLGITRSSAAVHISNLMKKGIILGKGYVFNDKITCLVVGGVHHLTLVDHETNAVRDEPSGFGYKMSLKLARLGLDATLLSVLPLDKMGDELFSHLQGQGVGMTHVARPRGVATPHLVKVRQGEEDLCWGAPVSREDMVALIEARHWLIERCEFMAVEAPLAPSVAGLACEAQAKPFLCTFLREEEYGDQDWLSLFDLVLVGVKCMARDAVRTITSGKRPNIVVMTDGSNGVVLEDQNGIQELNFLPGQGFDTEQDGEAFLAGMICGIAAGHSLRQAVRIAVGNASMAL